MSPKKKATTTKTTRKTPRKKPATTRKRTVKVRAKKPKPEVAAAPLEEERKPVAEARPQVEKPEVKPTIEIRQPVEVEPEVKPEVEKPTVAAKAVEVKEQVVEAKPEVVEAEKAVVEERPEAAQKSAESKPLVKPEVEEVVEVKPVEVKPAGFQPRPVKVKPLIKPRKKTFRPAKPLLAPSAERVSLVIRLRGEFGVPDYVERTLTSLRLKRKFNATLVQNIPSVTGMLREVKDYIAWGDVTSVEIARLLRERGEITGGSPVSDKFAKNVFSKESIDELAKAISNGQTSLQLLWQKGVNPVFHLHPPSGGFDTTGKRPFGSHGQLGYRGTAIIRLMSQMT